MPEDRASVAAKEEESRRERERERRKKESPWRFKLCLGDKALILHTSSTVVELSCLQLRLVQTSSQSTKMPTPTPTGN